VPPFMTPWEGKITGGGGDVGLSVSCQVKTQHWRRIGADWRRLARNGAEWRVGSGPLDMYGLLWLPEICQKATKSFNTPEIRGSPLRFLRDPL
jgi:hypothetical protein